MKFFVDTANLDEIREAETLGILDGVTTNPTLMAREGVFGAKNIANHYREICNIVNADVSAEVFSTRFEEMVEEGKALAALHPNIVVKVPLTRDGIKAIRWFSENNIKTNCTLVFSAGQAILAAKAGATYVSPFVGRIDDSGYNGVGIIHEIATIYTVQAVKTQILAASVRSPRHIVECVKVGAHVCTCPLSSILGLFHHPLTDLGLEKFLADARKLKPEVDG